MAGILCFSHGKDSGPWGTKISALADAARERDWRVESLDYRGMDPRRRARVLVDWCRQQDGLPLLVGSSMGAWVSLEAAAQVPVRAVFLLAPAVHVAGYEAATPPPPNAPCVLVHGWRDEVIPVDNAIRYAREGGLELHLLDDDHRLTGNLARIRRLFIALLEDC